MTLYLNKNQASAITSIECSPVVDGNTTFFHVKPGADAESAKQWIAGDLGQKIETETRVGDQLVVVTRGDKTEQQVVAALKARGDVPTPPEEKSKVNLWKLRGWASMIGQPLQLFSGFLAKGPPDVSTMGFAALNLTANATNIVFGQQDDDDIHHLHTVKKGINAVLEPHFEEGAIAPALDDKRADLRKTPEKQSIGDKIYAFAKRNSVTMGEIGLRYLAAIALVIPVKKALPGGDPNVLNFEHWKKGTGELMKGELKTAWKTLENTDRATRLAGLTYIAGKSIALVTQPEDPYNPKKPNLWDQFRQKVSFRLSSVIETGAAAIIAMDRLNLIKIKNDKGVWKRREISYDKLIAAFKGHAPEFLEKKAGQFTKRDWLGGIGGLLFTGGLVIRIFAPFGVKKVNMDEVMAHASDSLAMVPQERLPQALADTTSYLTEHFKGNKLEFGKTYNKLANDLYRYHHIALPGSDGNSNAPEAAQQAPAQDSAQPFARADLKKPALASLPRPETFQDRAAATQGESLQRA